MAQEIVMLLLGAVGAIWWICLFIMIAKSELRGKHRKK